MVLPVFPVWTMPIEAPGIKPDAAMGPVRFAQGPVRVWLAVGTLVTV